MHVMPSHCGYRYPSYYCIEAHILSVGMHATIGTNELLPISQKFTHYRRFITAPPRERHRQHASMLALLCWHLPLYRTYVGYTEQEAEGFHSHETSWKQLSQIACNCRHPTPNKSCLVCAGLPRRLPRLGSAGTPPRPSASSTPPRRRPMGLLVAAEVGHHWDQKFLPSLRRIRSPSS